MKWLTSAFGERGDLGKAAHLAASTSCELGLQLAYDRTAAVSEHHGSTGFDRGQGPRGQYIDAWIKLLHGDAGHGDQQRRGKSNHHNLEVGVSVCGVHRPVHGII